MRIDVDPFRLDSKRRVKLKRRPTRVAPVYDSEEHYKDLLEKHQQQMREQQVMLYASHRHALLIIFQAMDAAGKDGLIAHVMSGVSPQGCRVSAFTRPSAIELKHDFLWRTSRELPASGQIGIFNRSYYEEVLIARVHPKILGAGMSDGGKHVWQNRYRAIREHERHLHHENTHVLKIFLHLSKEEQRLRFLSRIDEPDKNWKFAPADVAERDHWDDYMRAYEACLQATSSLHAPWFVVPADDKKNARLIVSRIILDTLKALKLSFPKSGPARRRELKQMRAALGP